MEFICIGKIVNTHGIKGELRIMSRFEFIKKVFVPGFKFYIGKNKIVEEVVTYRHHKCFEMVAFKGYNDINQVLKYKGQLVYINKEDLVLSDNEYLDSDLIGLEVLVKDVKHGEVLDVEDMGNNNKVLVINDNGKRILVPYKKVFIKKIDLEKKLIIINEEMGIIV